jgi:hypothetical protein
MEVAALTTQVDALLALASTRGSLSIDLINQVFHGTISVLSAAYGTDSEQVKTISQIAAATIIKNYSNDVLVQYLVPALRGALRNLKAELDAGFVGTLRKRIAGDVLSDFIQLAKVALDESGDDAKNVAAVLAAAAYEDTIRRMGASFAAVIGRDDLSKVIDALKDAGILVAPQLGIALSYLNFRNHALHAEWGKIDRAAVHSVLGFVEQLLLKHFA